jgi:hypothetical protein
MRCLPFREQFDAAYCFWTSFGYFEDEGLREIREWRELDIAAGRVNADWTFTEAGRSETWSSSIRLYSFCELCALLREAGFERFAAYDTQTGEPFALGATRLGLVASLR